MGSNIYVLPWKNVFLAILVVLIFGVHFGSSEQSLPRTSWAIQGSSSQSDTGNRVTLDAENNIHITGTFRDDISFGSMLIDWTNGQTASTTVARDQMFMAKFHSNGTSIWGKRSVDGRNQGLRNAIDSTGAMYVTGTFYTSLAFDSLTPVTSAGQTDVYVAKFDNNGEALWLNAFGGYTLDTPYSLVVSDANEVYVSGVFRNYFTIEGQTLQSQFSQDGFIVKYDSSGAFQWSRGVQSDEGNIILEDTVFHNGNLYFTGRMINHQTTVTLTIGSSTYQPGTNQAVMYLGFVTPNGDMSGIGIWALARGFGVTIHDGFIYLVGQYHTGFEFGGTQHSTHSASANVFIGKIRMLDYEEMWSRTIISSTEVVPRFVKVDADGNIITGGTFSNWINFGNGNPDIQSAGGTDTFLIQYTSEGDIDWSTTTGGSGTSVINALDIDSDGSLYITGFFFSTIDILGTSLTSITNNDVFLARLVFCGSDWTGQNCEFPICFSIAADQNEVCSGRGNCRYPDTCVCDENYGGLDCSSTTCFSINSTLNGTVCSGNGDCPRYDECECDNGWSGTECQFPMCYGIVSADERACSNHGECSSINQCSCQDAIGNNCQIPSICVGFSHPNNDEVFNEYRADSGLSAGGAQDDESQSVRIAESGNIYVTGAFRDTAHFGEISVTSAGGEDIFIAKYSPTSVLQWVRRAGGNSNDKGIDLVIDDDENVYVTGYFSTTADFDGNSIMSEGSIDVFLAKYNQHGDLQWVKGAGGSGADSVLSASIDKDANIYIVGFFSSTAQFDSFSITSAGNDDIFIAKYNSSSVVEWVRRAGGNDFDAAQGVSVDNNGNIFVTGYISDIVSFDDVVVNSGNGHIFVAHTVQQDT